MTTIYKITNTINNKVYIGSTKNIKQRFNEHLTKLSGNYHTNKHLQSAYNKYGGDKFTFETLREVQESILRKVEQLYINKYTALNPKYGYNKAVVVSNQYDGFIKDDTVSKKKLYFGCYSKMGILIKVFRTINEVTEFLNVTKATRVYEACLSNYTKTANGYYWIKLDASLYNFKNKVEVFKRKGRHRKIKQYSISNDFIKEWDSAAEAAKELKLSSFNITRCLNKNNLYKNYKWFYSAP